MRRKKKWIKLDILGKFLDNVPLNKNTELKANRKTVLICL